MFTKSTPRHPENRLLSSFIKTIENQKKRELQHILDRIQEIQCTEF